MDNLTCVECGAGYNDHCECGDPDCEIGHGNGSCRNCGEGSSQIRYFCGRMIIVPVQWENENGEIQ